MIRSNSEWMREWNMNDNIDQSWFRGDSMKVCAPVNTARQRNRHEQQQPNMHLFFMSPQQHRQESQREKEKSQRDVHNQQQTSVERQWLVGVFCWGDAIDDIIG